MQFDLRTATEFIPNRLYMWQSRVSLGLVTNSNSSEFYWMTVDDKHRYEPFYRDFGPYHLGHTVLFCRNLNKIMNDVTLSRRKIVVVTSTDNEKRANAAYLICAYMLICQGKSPEEAYRPFDNIYPPFVPFRDASQSISTFNLTILECLKGINRAILHGFFNFSTFNVEEYFHYERVENGDLNWIIPEKFLAFSSPASRRITPDGMIHFTPEDYIPMFKSWGVTCVIRLNKKMYEARSFTRQGFYHEELYYPDGGLPPEDILQTFLQLVDEWFLGPKSKGAIAVHCKAGLGRTGTLIGLFMMKYYRFTATEAIAWLRVCRPGSVIGIQQHYLKEMQLRMWKEGEAIWKANYARISEPIPPYVSDSDPIPDPISSTSRTVPHSSVSFASSRTFSEQSRAGLSGGSSSTNVDAPRGSSLRHSSPTIKSSKATTSSKSSSSQVSSLAHTQKVSGSTSLRTSISSGKLDAVRQVSPSSYRLSSSSSRTATATNSSPSPPSSNMNHLTSSFTGMNLGKQAPIKRDHILATYNSASKKDDFLLRSSKLYTSGSSSGARGSTVSYSSASPSTAPRSSHSHNQRSGAL